MVFFAHDQYGIRSSHSTWDLLKAVAEKIARGFNMSDATPAVALTIPTTFNRISLVSFLHKFNY